MSDTETSSPEDTKPPKKFRPRISLTVLAIAMIAAGLSLGEWQVSRFSETTGVIELYIERHDTMEPLTTLTPPEGTPLVDHTQFRRINAKGTPNYDGLQLLTARYVLGRRGYKVLVPVRLPGNEEAIMTNLGWVPQEKLETYLKTLKAQPTLDLVGRLRRTKERNPAMKPSGEHLGYPTWMHTNTTAMSASISNLNKDIVLEAGLPASGKPVDMESYPLSGYKLPTRLEPSKHVEYAATWFSSAAAVFGVWLALSFRRVG